MASRFTIVIVLLLISVALVLSSKNSGKSKKKNPTPPTLSDNIDNNPFLQSINTTKILTYEGNPFLSNISQSLPSNIGNDSNPSISPVNNKYSEPSENHSANVVVFIRNPFLQGTISENNRTQVVPLNNSDTTSSVLDEKISVDNKASETSLYTDTKSKSELKCEEYAKQIQGTAEVLYLVGTNTEVIKISNEKCQNTNRLVVGGVNASPGEFPHMVALGIQTVSETFSFSCGGTLIAPEWVLTAAHCTYGPKSPTHARIGLHDVTDNQYGITTAIIKIMRHPSYRPPAMYADIALVKLNTIVEFSEKIRPACLYQQYDTVPMQAWVSGWGVTEFGGDQSDQLQKALLDIVDNLACAQRHNRSSVIPYGISPSMICAGDPRGGWNKDTCQGDSGGPLQIPHPKNVCLFQVLGITSFGQGCAVVNTPGVYTRVSHYLTWIEDTVWP